ncbi:hypothetical protein OCS_00293 [Ophiocordyceps sinensis CO18]|uniref:Uncharacterized protein n=1 Tax=Ophiocordyceps sinensis (strain Co18 / CGMCC 3.14243) TaxID=911162 RepID=T5AEV4_OPHSC|nr:hypothetical protein OCS_00293 [Ophiocordyceps sinensis CO18]
MLREPGLQLEFNLRLSSATEGWLHGLSSNGNFHGVLEQVPGGNAGGGDTGAGDTGAGDTGAGNTGVGGNAGSENTGSAPPSASTDTARPSAPAVLPGFYS